MSSTDQASRPLIRIGRIDPDPKPRVEAAGDAMNGSINAGVLLLQIEQRVGDVNFYAVKACNPIRGYRV